MRYDKPQLSGRDEIYRLEFGSYVLRIVKYSSLLEIPKHNDARSRISLILAGGVLESFGEVQMRLGPGWVIAKSGRYEHSNRFEQAGAVICSIEFASTELHQEIVPNTEQPSCWFVGGMVRQVLKLFELVSKDSSNSFELKRSARNVLRALVHVKQDCVFASAPSWLIDKLPNATDVHHDLGIQNLALDFGVVPDHLCRIIRQHFNCTTAGFVQRVRISRSFDLLAQEDLAISTAALEAGFADQAHMTRLFSRHLDMTPGRLKSMFHSFCST